MTEDEANTKWCPHAVASHTDPRAGFHADDPDGMRRQFPCIASACMAWRWAARPRVAIERLAVIGTYGEFVERPKTVEAGSGYCGLAGSDAP